MTKRDFYEVLELEAEATIDSIRQSYRRLAMKHHPDRNLENKEKAEIAFKELQEAYAVLSDPEKRAKYDRSGHEDAQPSYDMMAEFLRRNFRGYTGFGGMNGQQDPNGIPNNDVRMEIELTLEEIDTGVEKTVTFTRVTPCNTCDGTGSKTKQPTVCQTCHGARQFVVDAGHGYRRLTPCPACSATGTVNPDPCGDCGGTGMHRETATCELNIPFGLNENTIIRGTGKGDCNNPKQPPGDLMVRISVKNHQSFQRMNDDLACLVDIDFIDAAIGADLEITTLRGDVLAIVVPEKSTHRSQLRVKSHGLNSRSNPGNRGHLIVVLNIVYPSEFTDEQKSLLKQLKNLDKK